jgi:hypothetical protein
MSTNHTNHTNRSILKGRDWLGAFVIFVSFMALVLED